MDDRKMIEKYRDIFLQSKMTKLISLLESDQNKISIAKYSSELILLKASAYFELNQSALAKKELQNYLDSSAGAHTESYLYTLGRLAYTNIENDAAESAFLELLEVTDDTEYQLKALLGLANLAYSRLLRNEVSKEQFVKQIETLRFDIENCIPENDPYIEISYEMFLGHYERVVTTKSVDEALSHFYKALKLAQSNGWSYYILRCMYGIACVYEQYEMLEQMHWMFTLLPSFMNETENVVFSEMVNQKFSKYLTKDIVQVKFDHSNQRIAICDDWVALHDRPLLYKFLSTIHGQEAFVSKGQVAKVLWPDQEYKPRIHDPRIFDVAKRVRSIIEEKSDSIKLLSGRAGYKLVVSA